MQPPALFSYFAVDDYLIVPHVPVDHLMNGIFSEIIRSLKSRSFVVRTINFRHS